MKTGLFYSSTSGTTAEVARHIAESLKISEKDIYNVANTEPSRVDGYEMLILGTPTYGSGELQEDWYGFLAGLEVLDLKDKRIALFGTGDETMSDTFCDAVGILYDRLSKTGATMIGEYNTYPYRFDSSRAVKIEGGCAVGLLIDEINHPEATLKRIEDWTKTLI